MNAPEAQQLKTYSVVLRCTDSLLRFPPQGGIRIAPMHSPYGHYSLTIRTRTEQTPKIAEPLPRELWFEVSGSAPSIETAINIAVATADEYVRQVAFGVNAWQELLTVHLAYEVTPGARERAFFQNWTRDEVGLPRVARDIDADVMYRLLAAIASLSSPDKSRVLRAIVQYTDALQHWKHGYEHYALTHLYMGVEAVTPLVITQEVQRRGLRNRKALEKALNGPPPDSLLLRFTGYLYRRTGGHVGSKLDSWARREIIFRKDVETFRTAKAASDKLEHGTAHHAEIHDLATKAVSKTAAYLREAILSFLPLTNEDREQLVRADRFGTPLSAGGFDRRLLATLVSDRQEVAASDQLHPYIRWEMNLLDFKRLAGGSYEMRVNQKFSPVVAADASLVVNSVYFTGATPTSFSDIQVAVSTGAGTQEIVTEAGAHFSVDAPAVASWVHPFGSFILNSNNITPLARFWVTKLSPADSDTAQGLMLTEAVARIRAILAGDEPQAEIHGKCETAWNEAMELEKLRALLTNAYTRPPEGLVVPPSPPDGRASLITDVAQLLELNGKAVELVQRLGRLLDELLRWRARSDLQRATAQ